METKFLPTGKQVYNAVDGLSAMDGIRNKDGTMITHYKFGGTTRYAIAKNLRRMAEAKEDLEKTRMALIHEYKVNKTENGTTVVDQTAFLTFQNEWEKILNTKVDVVYTRIKLSALDLENNQIPVTAIAAVDWLLDE